MGNELFVSHEPPAADIKSIGWLYANHPRPQANGLIVYRDSSAPDGSSSQLQKALPEQIFSCSCCNHNTGMWENKTACMNMTPDPSCYFHHGNFVYSEMFSRESDRPVRSQRKSCLFYTYKVEKSTSDPTRFIGLMWLVCFSPDASVNVDGQQHIVKRLARQLTAEVDVLNDE